MKPKRKKKSLEKWIRNRINLCVIQTESSLPEWVVRSLAHSIALRVRRK